MCCFCFTSPSWVNLDSIQDLQVSGVSILWWMPQRTLILISSCVTVINVPVIFLVIFVACGIMTSEVSTIRWLVTVKWKRKRKRRDNFIIIFFRLWGDWSCSSYPNLAPAKESALCPISTLPQFLPVTLVGLLTQIDYTALYPATILVRLNVAVQVAQWEAWVKLFLFLSMWLLYSTNISLWVCQVLWNSLRFPVSVSTSAPLQMTTKSVVTMRARTDQFVVSVLSSTLIPSIGGLHTTLYRWEWIQYVSEFTIHLLWFCIHHLLALNPFSGNPIFGRKKKKFFLGKLTATGAWTDQFVVSVLSSTLIPSIGGLHTNLYRWEWIQYVSGFTIHLLWFWLHHLLALNPFSGKPIFGSKRKFFLGTFIATLVFMLERKILSSFLQPTDWTFSYNQWKNWKSS